MIRQMTLGARHLRQLFEHGKGLLVATARGAEFSLSPQMTTKLAQVEAGSRSFHETFLGKLGTVFERDEVAGNLAVRFRDVYEWLFLQSSLTGNQRGHALRALESLAGYAARPTGPGNPVGRLSTTLDIYEASFRRSTPLARHQLGEVLKGCEWLERGEGLRRSLPTLVEALEAELRGASFFYQTDRARRLFQKLTRVSSERPPGFHAAVFERGPLKAARFLRAETERRGGRVAATLVEIGGLHLVERRRLWRLAVEKGVATCFTGSAHRRAYSLTQPVRVAPRRVTQWIEEFRRRGRQDFIDSCRLTLDRLRGAVTEKRREIERGIAKIEEVRPDAKVAFAYRQRSTERLPDDAFRMVDGQWRVKPGAIPEPEPLSLRKALDEAIEAAKAGDDVVFDYGYHPSHLRAEIRARQALLEEYGENSLAEELGVPEQVRVSLERFLRFARRERMDLIKGEMIPW